MGYEIMKLNIKSKMVIRIILYNSKIVYYFIGYLISYDNKTKIADIL